MKGGIWGEPLEERRETAGAQGRENGRSGREKEAEEGRKESGKSRGKEAEEAQGRGSEETEERKGKRARGERLWGRVFSCQNVPVRVE